MCLAIEKIMTSNKPRVAYAIRLKDPEGNYYSLMDRMMIGKIGDIFVDKIWQNDAKVGNMIDNGCLHVSPTKKYLINDIIIDTAGWKKMAWPKDREVIIKIEIPANEQVYVGKNALCSSVLNDKPAWGCRTYKILEEVYVKNE